MERRVFAGFLARPAIFNWTSLAPERIPGIMKWLLLLEHLLSKLSLCMFGSSGSSGFFLWTLFYVFCLILRTSLKLDLERRVGMTDLHYGHWGCLRKGTVQGSPSPAPSQGHPPLHQVAPSPVQPDLECLPGYGAAYLGSLCQCLPTLIVKGF